MSTQTPRSISESEALSLLSSMRVGEVVWVELDGRSQEVTVQSELHHPDGFGHVYSQQVKVGYGPGRWNREITPAAMAAGYVSLTRSDSQRTCDHKWKENE